MQNLSNSSDIVGNRRILKEIYSEYQRNRRNVLLIHAFCGIGKTITLLLYILQQNIPFIFLVNSHELIDSILEKLSDVGYDVLHFEGKLRSCPNEAGKRYLKDYGQNQWYCESACPQLEDKICLYHQKLNQIQNGASFIGVHHQIGNVLHDILSESNHLLVLDENIFEALHQEILLPHQEIQQALPQFRSIPRLSSLLRQLQRVNEASLIHEHILEALQKLPEGDWNRAYSHLRKRIGNAEGGWSLTALVGLKILSKIRELQQFAREFPDTLRFLYFNKDGILYAIIFKKIPRHSNCIVLDGTMEKEVVKKFFPDNTSFTLWRKKGQFQPYHTILQIKGERRVHASGREYITNTFPRYRMQYKSNGNWKPTIRLKEWVINIKQIVPKFNKVLIVVFKGKHKTFVNYVSRQLASEHVFVRHYGSLKGKNEFEDCDCVILLGTPFLSDDDVKRMSHILGMDAQYLMVWLIKAEMNQDWPRIRPFNQTTSKTIIILSAYPIFDEDDPVKYVSEKGFMAELDCPTFKDLKLQRKILFELSQQRQCGKNDLILMIDNRQQATRKQIEKLKSTGYLFGREVIIGANRKKKEILHIHSALWYDRVSPSRIKVKNLNNRHIDEAFTDIDESNPPKYPEDYFEGLWEQEKWDRISNLLGLVQV